MRTAHTVWAMSNHTRCVRSNLAAEISRRDLTQARAAALAGLTPAGSSMTVDTAVFSRATAEASSASWPARDRPTARR